MVTSSGSLHGALVSHLPFVTGWLCYFSNNELFATAKNCKVALNICKTGTKFSQTSKILKKLQSSIKYLQNRYEISSNIKNPQKIAQDF